MRQIVGLGASLLVPAGKEFVNVSTGEVIPDATLLDQVREELKAERRKRTLKGRLTDKMTVEDTGLALGQALKTALGDKRGIGRYGFTLPMDECLAQAALDFSGRPYCVFSAQLRRERVGDLPTELVPHFFHSLCQSAGITLHLPVRGDTAHPQV